MADSKPTSPACYAAGCTCFPRVNDTCTLVNEIRRKLRILPFTFPSIRFHFPLPARRISVLYSCINLPAFLDSLRSNIRTPFSRKGVSIIRENWWNELLKEINLEERRILSRNYFICFAYEQFTSLNLALFAKHARFKLHTRRIRRQ